MNGTMSPMQQRDFHNDKKKEFSDSEFLNENRGCFHHHHFVWVDDSLLTRFRRSSSSSSKVKKTKRKVMYSWLLGILKRNETRPTNGKKQSNFNNKSKNDTDESIFLVVRSEHQHQQQRQNE
ncbi:hypothetical protein DERF_011043 [Dermatophagoides farinae]|uniref:Uncharacterized protein n=1 Tax=Dermatophagoides farinae TaxID=6954 RepID=A0A922KZW2_DERFA|nr:hypothetical protein DERF_011043 [Dermatophagoides farinae]